jgi:limonene-1,2-epoxide hydrolase
MLQQENYRDIEKECEVLADSTERNVPLALEELTTEFVAKLWSKTYNTQGKPDWSHLFQYYHPDIVFQDSIQRVEGIEQFQAMCNRLTKRCESLRMDLSNIMKHENVISMEWVMTMSFKKSPTTPLYGVTRLTLGEDGRIVQQRDYYDLWGDIFNNIPYFKKTYRKILSKYFG